MKNILATLWDPRDEMRRQACIDLISHKNISDYKIFPKLYQKIKQMADEDSLPVRFFARKALEHLSVLADSEGIDLSQLTTTDINEESLSEQIVKELYSKDKANRINAVYTLKRISRDPNVIDSLEEYAEEMDEDEAVLAIEAIEIIHKRIQDASKKSSSASQLLQEQQEQIEKKPNYYSSGEELYQLKKESKAFKPSKRWDMHPEDKRGNKILIIAIFLVILISVLWPYGKEYWENIKENKAIVEKNEIDAQHALLERKVKKYALLFSSKKWEALYEDFLDGRTTISVQAYSKGQMARFGDESFELIIKKIELQDPNEGKVQYIKKNRLDGKEKELEQIWTLHDNLWMPSEPR